MTYASDLEKWCTEKDVSYHELARRTGIDVSMVSRLARRITFPIRETAAVIFRETGVPVSDLFGIAKDGSLIERGEEARRRKKRNGK